jgi:hypothetical protein
MNTKLASELTPGDIITIRTEVPTYDFGMRNPQPATEWVQIKHRIEHTEHNDGVVRLSLHTWHTDTIKTFPANQRFNVVS